MTNQDTSKFQSVPLKVEDFHRYQWIELLSLLFRSLKNRISYRGFQEG